MCFQRGRREFFLQKLRLHKSARMVGLFYLAAAAVITAANTSTAQETGASAAREKEWAVMAALPDFSGVWVPDVKDQFRQEMANKPPWKAEVLAQIEHMLAEEKAGRPALILSNCLPHGMPSWMLITHN